MQQRTMPSQQEPVQVFYAEPSKREKRRTNLQERLLKISYEFEKNREYHYRDMITRLQTDLQCLHTDTSLPEFNEQLIDMEEMRDRELVRLDLFQSYMLERCEQEYERDMKAIQGEHDRLVKAIREKLISRLEIQKRRLKEDKDLLDIANDHSLLLSSAAYNNGPGSPGRVDSGSLGNFVDRRNLRRRGENNQTYNSEFENSGLFSSGKRKRKATTAYGSGAERNGRNLDEISAFWSDRDHFPIHREDARISNKSFAGVSNLKLEEALEDIAQIRRKSKRR